MTDTTPMPFGKYKNSPMQDVPAGYLLWLNDQPFCSLEIKTYIKENMQVLIKENKKA